MRDSNPSTEMDRPDLPPRLDQGIHDRPELGPRLQHLEVAIDLDRLGQLGVGVNRVAEQDDRPGEVDPRQVVALGLGHLEVVADLRDQAGQHRAASKRAWARPDAGTVLGTSRARFAASS